VAFLNYNGINFGSHMRTLSFTERPVYDESGVDILYMEVTLSVVAIIHPLSLTSNNLDFVNRAAWQVGTDDSGNAIVSIADGGTGYTVGDILYVQGGELFPTHAPTQFRVMDTLGGGTVSSVAEVLPPAGAPPMGIYLLKPPNPNHVVGGNGEGCVLDITWGPAGPITGGNAVVPGEPQNMFLNAGDRLGLAIWNLKQALSQPRKRLVYVVTPDVALISPSPISGGGFNLGKLTSGSSLPCDCRNGPLVQECRIERISGDKTAFLFWTVKTWVSDYFNAVLSNRWRSTQNVDSNGMTTRVIEGQAEFRADFIKNARLTPDHFREFLIPPCERGLQRRNVRVTASADGTRLDYTVTDQEQMIYYTGSENVGVVKVEGTVTCGVESGFKNYRDVQEALMKVGGFAAGVGASFAQAGSELVPGSRTAAFAAGVGEGAAAGAAWMASMWAGMPSAYGVVRVTGQREVDLVTLQNLAYKIILDRLYFVSAISPTFVELFLTQGISSEDAPWMEVRARMFCSSWKAITSMFASTDAFKLMNKKKEFGGVADPVPVGVSVNTPKNPTTTQLQAAKNTRGRWVGAMAVQAFTQDGSVPERPTTVGNTPDVNIYL
jgi:hypothetical protein